MHRPSSTFGLLLTTELAQTQACSLILSRVDYCNAVLHGAPSYSIKQLQRVQNNAARIVLQTPRRSHTSPLLRMLHWPVQQRIEYKVAQLTFKVRNTAITCNRPPRRCANRLRRRHLQRAPPYAVWNSLPKTVLNSDSVTV